MGARLGRSSQTPGDGPVFIRLFAGLVAAGLMASLLPGCGAASLQQRREPSVVVVYNNSDMGFRVVSLRVAPESGTKSARIGSVSPVPRGASQVFGRPTGAPPLPRVAEISWTDDHGRDYTRKVALDAVLRDATRECGDVLVFEVRPFGDLAVYCRDR